MSDQSNQPFGIPGGGPIGIPGGGPATAGPSLTKQAPHYPHQQGDPAGEAFVLAGWGARFGAWILDELLRMLLALPLPILAFLIFAHHPFSTFESDPDNGISNLGGIFVAWLVVYKLSAFVYAPVAMVNMNGATPGKKAVGIRVVTESGLAPTFGKAMLREPICKGIIVNGIGGTFFVGALLDYLWPLWDEQSRAGHDFMAHTRVIRDR